MTRVKGPGKIEVTQHFYLSIQSFYNLAAQFFLSEKAFKTELQIKTKRKDIQCEVLL
jgi:hypothetical protein